LSHVLDGHILTALATDVKVSSVNDLGSALESTNWRVAIACIRSQFGGLNVVNVEKEKSLAELDIVRENAILFLQHGIMYRDFSESIRSGDSGRIEHCMVYFANWFQASRHANYVKETMMHLVACLRKLWSPEFRQYWLDHCLVIPSGSPSGFVADDELGEWIIRELKSLTSHNATPETMTHLRDVLGRLPIFFQDVRTNIMRATGATDYYQHSSQAHAVVDIRLVADQLLRDKVFTTVPGRCAVGDKED
jgi:hypothetical protein